MGINNINGNQLPYTISYGDTLSGIARRNDTTVKALLEMNKGIKNPDRIYAGKTLVVPNNKDFVPREDYSPSNMNLGEVSVNGESLNQIGGKNITSNFYANNLAGLADESINDNSPATKIVVEMQEGKSMSRQDNNTPYSILNKALGDHLDNNSTIVQDGNGILSTKSQWLEKTDLYQAFISEDVNGDNFTGENNKLLSRGIRGNHVQLPSVEVDSQGTKYFSLHGKNNEILYFDATGKKVSFENGQIQGATEHKEAPSPQASEASAVSAPQSEEFLIRSDNNDKNLNIGKFYVNGKAIENDKLSSNFYKNNVNAFVSETLNDGTKSSRLDIQLNPGSQISDRDTQASDILKKMLGTNFDKTSTVVKDGDKYKVTNTPLKNTDLYKAFVSSEVNGSNFENDKIKRNDNGTNLVQFPSLEADANGVKYYILHTNDNRVLYFNDKGESIQPQE